MAPSCGCCWWKKSGQEDANKETQRRIRANDPDYNAQFNYANNFIKTSKYNLATFVPQNLLEQFQRLANFYFLCLLVLQLIPQVSSLTPVTTAVPLVVVLTVTALKDAIDDIQRHRSDSHVNNRLSRVLRDGHLTDERWHKVQVGDIIRMENDQFVAADLLLLSTSEPNGLCYIETAELDGETNLKCRQALPETAEMGEDNTLIGKFRGDIVCEPPNNNLSKFEGTLFLEGETYSLDNDKVLYRGCVLRNTRWCYGIVVFAGRDTKLMQNSGITIFKRTSLDRLLNVLIIGIVLFLLSLCLFCTIACGAFEAVTGRHFRIHLPWDPLVPKDVTGGATVTAVLVFFSYGIVMNTLVPISLYVSVEVIRFCHSLWINWDVKMYCPEKDTPAKARTTTLNEELGQIEYIFSDKTGTLTRNIMTFNKCSIGGRLYGEFIDEATGEPIPVPEGAESVDLSFNPMVEAKFRFYDTNLVEAVQMKDSQVHEFFRLLALCHTVMSEEKPGGILEYQAQSPDEEALTSAARNFGFVFRNRTPTSVTIEVMGTKEVYELYAILDFNNVRKRMSVILRKDGMLKLYCKGADSVIFERLHPECSELKEKTLEHLNKFAGEGLRTLCLAAKDLDEEEFETWKEEFHKASTSLEDREGKVDACYEAIEKDMRLLGASAIEDKLQEGVPQAIANLVAAGIKLWVLTGDKQETAINIGYSCQLLSDDMVDIFIVDAFEAREVREQLCRHREAISNVMAHSKKMRPSLDGETNEEIHVVSFNIPLQEDFTGASQSSFDNAEEGVGGFALVVNGHSLTHALEASLEEIFLDVASRCRAVICCRVTPLQKALVVDLVKRRKRAVTLAIGDGANDVSMIKMAHIGVGISGQEGMQAVLASDFSLAQFRFLERLLLVHGRWSYFRMSKFLRYFFYKNFAFTLCHFWFAFFCGFSAQTVYDPAFISFYNVFYTSLPVLALGIFDQDVNDVNSLRYPCLYTPGHSNLLFNKREFVKSVLHGLFTSFALFFVPYGAFYESIEANGIDTGGQQFFGTAVSALLVFVVTAQIALDTTYWTVFNHIVIWGSVAFFVAMTLLINSNRIGNRYMGSFRMTLATPAFWFTVCLTMVTLLIPILAARFYQFRLHPTLADRVRLLQRYERRGAREVDESILAARRPSAALPRRPSLRRRKSVGRSGYAFAHQEGFGRLITSGKIMRKSKSGTSFGNHLLPPLLPGPPQQFGIMTSNNAYVNPTFRV